MRIAHIGCHQPHHTESEICDYLELAGYEVDRFQFDHLDTGKFIRRAAGFDLVITSLPQTFPPDFWRVVKREGPRLCAWYFDWIANWGGREQQYLPRLREFDLIISTDGFENAIYDGLPRFWLPHAADPRTYFPVTIPGHQASAGFIGHMYLPRRREMIRALMKRYDFAQMGLNNECWGPRYAEACASVKIMLGDNFRNDHAGYWSDRLYLSLACGSFLLYPRVPGLSMFFEDGKHLVMYDSGDDLVEKIDHYLVNPHERMRIATAGTARVHERHTWAKRVNEFLEILSNSG